MRVIFIKSEDELMDYINDYYKKRPLILKLIDNIDDYYTNTIKNYIGQLIYFFKKQLWKQLRKDLRGLL